MIRIVVWDWNGTLFADTGAPAVLGEGHITI
jgi:hypothetical protein